MHAERSVNYQPGFIGFPSGSAIEAVKIQVDVLHDFNETQEPISLKVENEVGDNLQKLDDLRRRHEKKIQEEGVKAELEYIRLGGRIPENNNAAAELRQIFDSNAKVTEEERHLLQAWGEYDKAWDRLLLSVKPMKKFVFRKISFAFDEVPWPILKQYRLAMPISNSGQSQLNRSSTSTTNSISFNDFTAEAIAQFLLHPLRDPGKSRKDKLRDAILHYHPDKFNRFLHRIVDSDRARVLQGIDLVIKALNRLMHAQEF